SFSLLFYLLFPLWTSVDIKPDVPLAVEPLSPLDLRTDLRMLGPGSDPGLWERQLQQELLLIQKQQQIQKQLLISEFQKQHEKLTRQHQAQLQEHLKLQQELQAMKQQQELAEKERRLEQQQQQNQQEKEQERLRREQHVSSLSLRGKERSRESKSSTPSSSPSLYHQGRNYSQYFSKDNSFQVGIAVKVRYSLSSEPNLKVRSRLKQKVAERRSSPMLKRRDGNIMTPYKKRALELMDSTPTNSAPGSGPSSPIGASSALGAENGPSSLPTTTKTEVCS
ncbi:histone deacetylase 9-B-like, partial [Seriola lalandi dorsalis]|uniref:histone deacetylase 9-B-like n=1 Tax=Seriola lalandi dorsalis TaxID=1841481 RepID=UPI000C6F5973